MGRERKRPDGGGRGTRDRVREKDVVSSSVNRYILAQVRRGEPESDADEDPIETEQEEDGGDGTSQPDDTEIARLHAAIDDLRSAVDGIAADVTDVVDQTTGGTVDPDRLNKAIEELEAVGEIPGRIGQLEDEVAAIRTARPDVADGSVDAVREAVVDLRTAQEQAIAELGSAVAQLQTTVERIVVDLEELKAAVEDSDPELADRDTDEHESSDRTQQLAALQQSIAGIEKQQQQQTALLEDELAALRERVEQIERAELGRTHPIDSPVAGQADQTQAGQPPGTENMARQLSELADRLAELQDKQART